MSTSSYDAIPDFGLLYDSVPLYAQRTDVAFYVEEAKAAGGTVLELGCGTGRILLPIARAGCAIAGLDNSREMLARCRHKLAAEPPAARGRGGRGGRGARGGVTLHEGDIHDFDLGSKYALIIAPFRVVQHLTTVDEQLRFLAAVGRHLAPHGRFIFDVFNPRFDILVGANGAEREDTAGQLLPDGRTFRRTYRIAKVRWLDQVSESELIYIWTASATSRRSTCAGTWPPSSGICWRAPDSPCARCMGTSRAARWWMGRRRSSWWRSGERGVGVVRCGGPKSTTPHSLLPCAGRPF